MFINQHGAPTKDPAVRRAINIHLSNIARQKRPKKYDVEKLDRRRAQQQRRAREAANARGFQNLEDQALIYFKMKTTSLYLSLHGDFLQPEVAFPEDKIALKACQDCESY